MSLALVKSILATKYNQELADKVIDAYLEIEQNFFLQKWKPSELDAGHFTESVRRIIEFEQNAGNYTAFSTGISQFNDQILTQYERGLGHESIRILIPRILRAIYGVRNKRGVAHISDVLPNEMDATLILYNVKWVLAELVRLATNKTPRETQTIIDEVIERHVEVLWKGAGFRRILDTKIPTPNQILILLYDESPQKIDSLRDHIQYANVSRFKTIVTKLAKIRLIEFKATLCTISPTGRIKAEAIIKALKTK